jgi:hypothetical protein
MGAESVYSAPVPLFPVLTWSPFLGRNHIHIPPDKYLLPALGNVRVHRVSRPTPVERCPCQHDDKECGLK